MITDEDKERVRRATDFFQLVSETVELRRRGSDWWGCCPFHHEKTPSFHINPSTGLWKCFGCGLGGDVFGYVMHRENLEFVDAVRFLADRAGIELVESHGGRRGPRRIRLIECMEEAQSYYAKILNRGRGRGPAQGRAYLSNRGFGSDVCRRWGLGYAPGNAMLVSHLSSKGFTNEEMEAADLSVLRNGYEADRFYDRVMFPIRDEQGRTIAFGGRVLTDAKPKYLNTKETAVFHKGKHLFAFDKAKEHIAAKGEAIVCEGYTDVMAMHEAGFNHTVAALGTSFSLDHVRTLARFAKRIICMFDGDAAGQRAAERAIQFIDKSEADLRCVVLPNGQDPAEFLDANPRSAMEAELAKAEPLMDFVLRKRLESIGPTAPGGVRMAALDDLAGVLAPLRDSVLLDEYAMVVGDWLGVAPEEVKRAIRSKPLPKAQDTQRGSWSRQGTRQGNVSDAPPYDSQGYVPDDYVPVDAYQGGPPVFDSSDAYAPASDGWASQGVALTSDDRLQLQAERELLSLMATNLDQMREHADRISSFLWADERHEAMAWAMLATPEGTDPGDVVRAAESVVPEAPRLLSSGRVATVEGVASEAKIGFVLDTVELYSTRRKIKELRARMRAGDGTSAEMFAEAADLQKHANQLANRVSSGFNR